MRLAAHDTRQIAWPLTSPFAVAPDGDQVDAILDLLKRSFAFMDPRIDPPSSVLRLTTDAIRAQCEARGSLDTWVAAPCLQFF